MAYTLMTPQPAQRAAELDYDDVGPGLYNDETALALDEDTFVAVSVVPKWLENGGGVAFTGYARWINEDGSTHLSQYDQHIETNLNFTADAPTVQKWGVNAIAKEIILAMLGEEPTLVVHEEGAEERPLINWSSDMKLNVNIRYQIECVEQTGPTAIDAGNILGL